MFQGLAAAMVDVKGFPKVFYRDRGKWEKEDLKKIFIAHSISSTAIDRLTPEESPEEDWLMQPMRVVWEDNTNYSKFYVN